MVCQQCGRENVSGKFCRGCGAALTVPVTPPQSAGGWSEPVATTSVESPTLPPSNGLSVAQPPSAPTTCPNCTTAVSPGAAFCGRCGAPIAAPALEAGTRCAYCRAELQTGARFCGSCGAPTTDSSPPLAADGPGSHPPPVIEMVSPSQRWAFQQRSTEIAAQVVGSLGQAGVSPQSALGGMLARMIRAALFDKTIYREVAADETLQQEAWQVTGLVIALGSFGTLVFSLLGTGAPRLTWLVSAVVIQLIAWLVRIWAVQLALSLWLKQPTDFRQLFRALSYGQSPAALRFVPVVGQLVELWAFVANAAAIRDLTGRTTVQAVILAIIGFMAAAVATSAASNLLMRVML